MSAFLKALAIAVGVTTAFAGFATGSAGTPTAQATTSPTVLSNAATSTKKPITVVLTHGAWADSSSWSGETRRLLASGYAVRAADTSDKDLQSDVASLVDLVRTIDGPVLLVGHSYGGAVITNAAAQARNVVGLVYVDAYEPAPGESVAQLSGATSVTNTLPQDQLFQQVPGAASGTANVLLTRTTFLHHFASDIPKAKATQLWATQTITNTAALQAPTTKAAWKTLPSWAFISTGDQIITPAAKESMAHRAGSSVTTFRGGSHVTLISHPAAVTSTIEKALTTLERKQS